MQYQISDWLPTTPKEAKRREWDEMDVVLFSGDAYVDHPSFGAAVIARIIESEGLKIAVVPQPNWQDDLRDFKKFGTPRLFFGITAGCMDSMVNHYTANRHCGQTMPIPQAANQALDLTTPQKSILKSLRNYIQKYHW